MNSSRVEAPNRSRSASSASTAGSRSARGGGPAFDPLAGVGDRCEGPVGDPAGQLEARGVLFRPGG